MDRNPAQLVCEKPKLFALDYCIIAPAAKAWRDQRGLRKSAAAFFMSKNRKKPKPFRAVTAVKSAAREAIGAPPVTRRVPDRTKTAREKHKPTLGKLLDFRD